MKSKRGNVPQNFLEKLLAGAEPSESALHFVESSHLLEKASHASTNLITAVSVLEHVLPPLKVALSGLLALYLGYKYLVKYAKKKRIPTKLQLFGLSINLGATLGILALGIVALVLPALLPVLTLSIALVGLVRETFNFVKTAKKQQAAGTVLSELQQQGEKPTLEQVKRYHTRRWKMGSRMTDVVIGVLTVAAIAVVIGAGPFGWLALAGVALIGIGVKVGLIIAKNYSMKKLAQQATVLAIEAPEGKDETHEHSKRPQPKPQPKHGEHDHHHVDHPKRSEDILAELRAHPDKHHAHEAEDRLDDERMVTVDDSDPSPILSQPEEARVLRLLDDIVVDSDEKSDEEGEGEDRGEQEGGGTAPHR